MHYKAKWRSLIMLLYEKKDSSIDSLSASFIAGRGTFTDPVFSITINIYSYIHRLSVPLVVTISYK